MVRYAKACRRRNGQIETAMSNPPGKKIRRTHGGPSAIGAFVPGVTRAAFGAHGFPSASVLSDWPDIIGAEFADITSPERLIWPRGAEPCPEEEGGPAGRTRHRRAGATLVLRVDGPRSLEIQHIAPQLLERINIYFGYRAVSQLRIIQGPVHREKEDNTRPAARARKEIPLDREIGEEGLRAALSKLAANID
ncbi:MAG TPA: DUF721 domain-containing protein [Rhizobiales bacterium]|nr:DUF721 domain-containing protein [Hyphomicrobiales bacterium]